MIPVFVDTWEYHSSYYDYWKLVKVSGFHIVRPEEVDISNETMYVFTGTRSEFKKRIERLGNLKNKERKAILVYYQIERPDSGPDEAGKPLMPLLNTQVDHYYEYFDIVWMPYGYLANRDFRVLHVPLGSHPKLREAQLSERKEYDLAVLANPHPRRHATFEALSKSRWRIAWNVEASERPRVLASSRAQFAVHQTPSPLGEPQRLAFSAAYELPLLTETIEVQRPLEDGVDFLSAPIDRIMSRLDEWLARPDLPEIGRNLYRKLVLEEGFQECITRAARRTVEWVKVP